MVRRGINAEEGDIVEGAYSLARGYMDGVSVPE